MPNYIGVDDPSITEYGITSLYYLLVGGFMHGEVHRMASDAIRPKIVYSKPLNAPGASLSVFNLGNESDLTHEPVEYTRTLYRFPVSRHNLHVYVATSLLKTLNLNTTRGEAALTDQYMDALTISWTALILAHHAPEEGERLDADYE